MPTLYRRILGPAFDQLPPALRQFHDLPEGGRGTGTFRVTRGQGWFRNLLAGAIGLPAQAEQVPVRLQVVVEGDRERWLRDFAGHRVVSLQWEYRGLLIEKMGPVSTAFRLVVEQEALRFEMAGAWLLGIPLPRALSVRVEAITVGQPVRLDRESADPGAHRRFAGSVRRLAGAGIIPTVPTIGSSLR